jgi:hypothetical protein
MKNRSHMLTIREISGKEDGWTIQVSVRSKKCDMKVRVFNLAGIFNSVGTAISGIASCRTFGRNARAASRLMPLQHFRFLKTAPLFLIGFWALTSSVLFPATFENPENSLQTPVPIDFSFAGYEAGRPVPSVKGVLAVRPSGGDDTALLQGALDRVASMPVGADGFRGAVVLSSGRFRVKGQLHMRASGVALRGAGAGSNGTVIVAEGIGRRTLIEVGAEKIAALDSSNEIQGDVPAGGKILHLASTEGFAVGDHVVVRRPSTQEWIGAIGMTNLPGNICESAVGLEAGVA